MPKRQKESKLLPGEGRPTGGFSLGDFLSTPAQSSHRDSGSGTDQVKSEEFPSLSNKSCWTKPPDVKQSLNTSETTASSSTTTTTTSSTASSSTTSSTIQPQLAYSISKTKKGSLPVRLENRNKGKKVTVIFNVSGDARELLKELKHAAGCGGVIREDTVELQGEKVDLVEKFLISKLNMKKK